MKFQYKLPFFTTLPVIGVDTFSLSRSSAYKELYFLRKILKPEVDVNTCCCRRWWHLLLGSLVLRPSISSLLQSATSVIAKCDSFFYCKVRWSVIIKCDSFFITKCDKCYYKVRQVLQSVTILLQSATVHTILFEDGILLTLLQWVPVSYLNFR